MNNYFDAFDHVAPDGPIDPGFDAEAFDTRMDAAGIVAELFRHADAEQAEQMAAYMRDQFPFLGVRADARKALTRPYFKVAKKDDRVDWSFVSSAWAYPQREFQYVAVDYLRVVAGKLSAEDLPKLHTLIESKSWWDTVDMFHPVIRQIAEREPEAKTAMREWARADNVWTRRSAIIFQLGSRAGTDTELLSEIIVANLGRQGSAPGTEDFFINKAIGWALREYSKTDADWVRAFLADHELANLSMREASRYL